MSRITVSGERGLIAVALATVLTGACSGGAAKSDGGTGGKDGAATEAVGGAAGSSDGGVDSTADVASDAAGAGGAGTAGGGGAAGGAAGSAGAAGTDGGVVGSDGAAGGTGGTAGDAGTGGIGGILAPLVIDVSTATNPVAPGQRLLYTITVGNVSSHAVDAVSILFRVPTGIQFNNISDAEPNTTVNCSGFVCVAAAEATWNLGTIDAGVTESISINALVLQNVGEGDSISAPVTLTATGIVNPIMLTKTVQVHVAPSAQLSLGTVYSPVTPSQSFTLDVDVGQIGTTPLTGAELRASLPAGLTAGVISDGGTQPTAGVIVWPIGGLAVGAALHRTVSVTTDASVLAGSVLAAHATLTFDGGVAVDATADFPVSVVAASPPIKVDVGLTGSPAVPGGRLLYTATITNVSLRAIDAVSVLLRTPNGVSMNNVADVEPDTSVNCAGFVCGAGAEAVWNLGTMAWGSTHTIVMNAAVVAPAVGDGSLISAPFLVRATGVNEIRVATTVPVFTHPAAQLIIGTVSNPVMPGQAFTLNVDLGQIGASALTGTTVNVSLPPGLTVGTVSGGGTQPTPGNIVWSIGPFAVGATLHESVAVTADAAAVGGTILSAHAILTYDGGNAIDAVSDYAVSVAPAAMPIKIDVVPTPTTAVPGNRLLYTATITNTSARAVDAVALRFRVPAMMQFNNVSDADPDTSVNCSGFVCVGGAESIWNLGTLVVGQIKIVTVNAQVLGTLLGGSIIPASMELTATGLTSPLWVQTTVPTQ